MDWLDELLEATEPEPLDDAIASHLRDDDPIEALKLAKSLPRTSDSLLLLARCHVAMGSLCAAARAYTASGLATAAAELIELKEYCLYNDYMWQLMQLWFPRGADKVPQSSTIYDGEFEVPPCPELDDGQMGAAIGVMRNLHCGYRVYLAGANDAAEQKPAVPVDWLGRRREARGVILYFHGNGEVADDYVDLAPQFHWLGFHLMIVDYRGYGWSSPSTPLMSHLLSDVEPLLLNNAFDSALEKAGVPKGHRHPSRCLLFGRSMGSNCAVHCAAARPERFCGLVLDSSIGSGRSIITGMQPGRDTSWQEEAIDNEPPPIPMPGGVAAVGIGENLGKMRRVALPLLLLHGDEDVVTPPSQATALHAASAASDKQLTFIKGKGHNDLGLDAAYFEALREFCERVVPE